MATLPSPTQVAGQHTAIYETYYNVVDPKGFGSIGGMEAARFLKRSGLSDVILSKIWDLSDPGGRGCLDKTGMFVALKLVALVQNGKDLSVNNVHLDLPPPKMGDIPLPKPQKPPPPSATPLITSLPPTAVDWSIKPTEREKYEKLFESLQPLNGLIAGNKVKNVLMESKLPFETLGKIWDLADQDKDGMLDRYEFIAAMHLVYKALDKFAIPNSLPIELMAPAKRKTSISPAPPILNRVVDGIKPDITPSSLISQSLITSASMKPVTPPLMQPVVPWVVTTDEKAKSDALFIKSDVDKDGFVSGQEIKDVFLQSGVPQPVLAHIWALCDIKQSGKLNNEQFALAMWLVARCLKGIDLPSSLAPEMVPPSFRSSKPDGLVENNNTKYSNPDLEMISKDIEQLSKERLGLETEITQKEADIRIKRSEITSLQSELDTLAATLKQLENQKGEAQKRLNDLKAQSSANEVLIAEFTDLADSTEIRVDKLRTQAAEQSTTVSAQESELNKKKQQLEGLKQEEERLEKELSENTRSVEKLTCSMQESQLNISQAKALKTQLEEQARQFTDAVESYDAAITSGDISHVADTTLRINPDFREAKDSNLHLLNGIGCTDMKDNPYMGYIFQHPAEHTLTKSIHSRNINPFLMPNLSPYFDSLNEHLWPITYFGNSQDDPFSDKSKTSGFDEDPFHNDPFKNTNAFSAGDAFSATFGASIQDSFSTDPFEDSTKTTDPFDAFGDSRKNSDATSLPQEPDKDPFGCDPFAILHAPTRDGSTHPRPSSPSPALPPKKSKQPPPRPAPPRPQPPKKTASSDAFGNDTFGSSGGFADFSDFDSKLSHKTSPTNTTSQVAASKSTKGLEFVDDPFRDYRYEDPFNISFEDEEQLGNSNKSESVDAFNTPKKANNEGDSGWDNNEVIKNKNDFGLDKFDPFGLDGRQSVPLPSIDLFAGNSGRASAPINSKVLSEDQQLAWAATESLRLEKERQRRLMQEEADLKLAISLSKAESKKH